MSSSQLRQFMAEASPFRGVDPAVLALIEDELERHLITGGSVLFRQGDAGDRLYIVMSGRLRATITNDDGHEEVLGDISRGQSVGEMALIADADRSATVRAVRDSEIVSLSKEAYERLIIAHPKMLVHLSRTITRRYMQQIKNSQESDRIATLTVVPASADVDCARLVRQLSTFAGKYGRVAHVRRCDGWSTPPDISALEWNHDLVILETDTKDSAWTRHCVEAADRVLLIADGSTAPAQGMAWSRFHDVAEQHNAARWDLGLLWPDDAPRDSARWLAAGPFDRWHHLSADSLEDIARLARWVCGRAVGLVLSGGGARAFAHIGVIRALRAAEVPIDAVGGTSMGAVIAALVAADHDDEQLLQYIRRSFVEGKPLADVTIPAVSLVAGRRISRLLRVAFGDTRIEDLPRSMFAISCNLTRGCAIEHRTGPLWRALRASIAIPGVISPSIQDGDLLVDGGIIDNLPVGPMRSMGVGHLIAVDAAAERDMKVNLSDRDSYLARDVLRESRGLVNGSAAPPPGILDILLRAVTLGTTDIQQHLRKDVDLLLRPNAADFRMLDWKCLDRAAARGLESTTSQIAHWNRTNQLAIRGAAA